MRIRTTIEDGPDGEAVIWARYPLDPSFEVSYCGRVRKARNRREVPPSRAENGYFRVSMGGRREWLHRVVGFTWVRGFREGLEINHLDLNPANNHARNLEWVTHAENMAHAARMQAWAPGAQKRAQS